VVVEAKYQRQIQRTRHEIVVLPVALALVEQASGDIAIQNSSQTEIDLAGYRLVGNKSFTIPDYTILLPRSEIVVNQDIFLTGSISPMVALYDQAGEQVAIHLPDHLTTTSAAPTPVRPAARLTPRISAIDDSPRYTFASAVDTVPSESIDVASTSTDSAAVSPGTQAAAARAATLPSNWPYYALVGILLLGTAAVYLIPQSAKSDDPWA